MMRKYDDDFKQQALKKILDGQNEILSSPLRSHLWARKLTRYQFSETFSYIKGFYNRISLHSGLGYKSPLEFEKELKTKQRSESLVS